MLSVLACSIIDKVCGQPYDMVSLVRIESVEETRQRVKHATRLDRGGLVQ